MDGHECSSGIWWRHLHPSPQACRSCSILATWPPIPGRISPARAHPSMAGVAERPRTKSQLGHSMGMLPRPAEILLGGREGPKAAWGAAGLGTDHCESANCAATQVESSPSTCIRLVLWERDGTGIALQLGINTVRPCRRGGADYCRPAVSGAQRATINWRAAPWWANEAAK